MKCTAVKHPALKCARRCWGEFWAFCVGSTQENKFLQQDCVLRVHEKTSSSPKEIFTQNNYKSIVYSH